MKCLDINSLMRASINGQIDHVNTLLSKGSHVNNQGCNVWTPLMLASMHGHQEIVETLLRKGADVNIQDKYGIMNVLLDLTLFVR